jgi:hypothetical protein
LPRQITDTIENEKINICTGSSFDGRIDILLQTQGKMPCLWKNDAGEASAESQLLTLVSSR